jgi:hypothetical protein
MDGGAFVWLKTGQGRPESAKQAEIGLASLSKILWIGGRGVENRRAMAGKDAHKLCRLVFRWIWLIHVESRANVSWITMFAGKLAHYPARKCRGFRKEMQAKVEISIGISFYTEIYAKSAVDQCFGRDVLTKNLANTSNVRCPGPTDSALRPRNEICPSWKWFRIVPSSDKHGSIRTITKILTNTVAH